MALSVVAAFLGMAIVRAGFFGEYLGHGRFASFLKVHPNPPEWYHRTATVALGAIVILFSSALFTLLWVGSSH